MGSMKIRTKIILSYITIFLLCFSVVGLFLNHSLKNFIVQSAINRLSDHALLNQEIILPVFDEGYDAGLLQEHAGLVATNLSKNDMHVRIYDQTTLLAAASSGIALHYPAGQNGLSRVHQAAMQGDRAYLFRQEMIYYALPILYREEVIGALEYVYPLAEELQTVQFFNRLFLLNSAAALLLIAVTGHYTAGLITGPLKKLTAATRRFSRGSHEKIAVSSRDEIRELTESFNEMSFTIKNQLENIELQKNRLDLVLSNLHEGVTALDHKGSIIFQNEQWQHLLPGEFPGELQELVEGAFQYGQAFCELDDQNRFLRAEAVFTGEVCIVVLRDMTADKKLLERQKEFLSNVSHELKTPVTAVSGYIELLKMEKRYDEEAVEYLEKEADRIKQIVLQLLELARLENFEDSLTRSRFSLGAVVQQIAENMSVKAAKFNIGITVKVETPGEDFIYADVDKISQVVINMLDNAIKFSASGQEIEVRLFRQKAFLVLEVEDRGIGIPKDDLERIFERFYRCSNAAATGGSGLGLSISKEIVHRHGGFIEVESEINEGSTFRVKLPLDLPGLKGKEEGP